MVDISVVREDVKNIAQRHNVCYFEATDLFNENIDSVFHYDYQKIWKELGIKDQYGASGLLTPTFFGENIIYMALDSEATRGFNYHNYNSIVSKDKLDLMIPYHELAHTLQHENNMFSDCKNATYKSYLKEMHSECFAFAALMLRAENPIDFIRQAHFAYKRGIEMTDMASMHNDAKLYASLPVMKETIKQIWKNRKNKAVFFREDGGLNEDYLSQFALDIVKRSAYSEKWFDNFNKKHHDRYKKYKFLLNKHIIRQQDIMATIFPPVFKKKSDFYAFNQRAQKLEKYNDEIYQKIGKLVEGAFYVNATAISSRDKYHMDFFYDLNPTTSQEENLVNILTTSPKDRRCKEYYSLREADTQKKLKKLLKDKIDINARDVLGYTALMDAEDIKKTILLVNNGADINAKTKTGVTALMTAQTAKQIEFLLKAGADINAQDDFGFTALMLVNTAKQAKVLLEAGADINIKNCNGDNAFELIKQRPHISYEKKHKILHLLEVYSSPQQKKNLISTTSQKIKKQVRNISYEYHRYKQKIKTGIIALAVTASGTAFAVHQKAEYDHEQKVIELTETLKSPQDYASKRDLCLSYSGLKSLAFNEYRYGYFNFDKIVDDVNALNEAGFTPLTVCNIHDEIQTAKKLIELGADVNAKNKDGSTALMHAQTPEQTQLLLKAGADVNAKDDDGRTVLMYAKTQEQKQLLLEAGAKDNDRRLNYGYSIDDIIPETENTRERIERNKEQYKKVSGSLKRVKQQLENKNLKRSNDVLTPVDISKTSQQIHFISSENERD